MFTNGWFLGSLGIAIIVLIGLIFWFRKTKKTIHFYTALITFLILAAIFLHGVSFKLN
ncbi:MULTISPECIES: hypothetical protein [Legionellaceae]|jgi:lipoprotein signal peptidase|uniref:Uncharacterized protein n=1 Tax=Legionella bononiensis TaxID=2793102 RepID=A0ABS1WF28_9GAMM|nr:MULTISPECIES: hypothetical protein [Legionellaceae]ERH41381.1 hypothetical protein N750_16770 [Legionella pneumophila str. Leg01/53]ERI46803.1 hypothetical protein N749_16595 [Legionella pneumophila str. Leg01/20]KTD12234.1 hypothetical protein Lhac_1105 [Legionella hackeliae]MBL7478581.1 hypothetical protein [Legionella bononiensis]MBL7527957.1 hypothetical protein [Legionella bononiensis]